MLFFRSPGHFGPDPLLVLVGALLLDALLGDMPFLFRRLPHPIALVGNAVSWFERRLNRPRRSEGARRVRGIVTVILLVGGAALLGYAVETLCRAFARGWILELVIIAVLVAQRSLFDRVRDVAEALARKGLDAGRAAVRHIVGRDPQSLDAHGVARAGIESLAENLSDGVVAPVFWTLLLGLPGLFAYKTANTLDSMIGHRSPRYRSFGWAAARLDDVLNLAPARLTGALIALAAFLAPQAAGSEAVRIMLRDAGKHRSPNAGWPEAAMAGSLGLALVGPRRYDGHVAEDPWLGDGRARAMPADINRALFVYVLACALQAAAILALFILLPPPHLAAAVPKVAI
ncbi:MAG TPA: adenosylcobinamide-phosphate synthase CbiB [Stellaceae bacterium]|nr:adenosylcobinamide-phosphate synthase CbiB [Stellaceae bacterium]